MSAITENNKKKEKELLKVNFRFEFYEFHEALGKECVPAQVMCSKYTDRKPE